MIKTKTIEEYDSDGKLVRKTTTETEETNDNPTRYIYTSAPYTPPHTFCFDGNKPQEEGNEPEKGEEK